jgi:hypothetical protein
MIRLVQIQKGAVRRVGVVVEPQIRLLERFDTVYSLAWAAITDGTTLSGLIEKHATNERLDYDPIYNGESDWRLLTPMDHPEEPARCLVSGTGLTHFGSARSRDAMHQNKAEETTDSMRMFRWGVDKGRPERGQIGVAPEWFFKGVGTITRACGEPLMVPSFAGDGGEEAELAGIYLVGPDGMPHRVGMAQGNEFADHRFEKLNYLNLAGSKIRTCSFGPELAIAPEFRSVPGKVGIERAGKTIWSKEICTGESEMTHSLANIEHHHFKFESHRRAGDMHVHFFGAHSISFADNLQLADGDVAEIAFEGFGRPLRNPIEIVKGADALVFVKSLA